MSKEDTATAADVRAPDRFNNYVLRTVEMLARNGRRRVTTFIPTSPRTCHTGGALAGSKPTTRH